jgi:hypothetical protein
VLVAGLVISLGSAVVGAQTQAAVSRTAAVPEGDILKAQAVREEFVKVLQRYPPAVGAVLKLDPSLLASDPYLTPYPAITAFLAQHPEVRHSPAYYFEPVRTGSDYYAYYDPKVRAWQDMTDGVAVFVVMVTVLGAFGWLIRTAVDYRRWGRLAKVQAEAHTKLLDRFNSNEELLAYVKSSAGARFLESAPIALDGAPRTMGVPMSRILWSMQAGIVLLAAGIGMNYVSRNIDPDVADPVFTFSVILISLGVGFVVSSGLSYVLSRRMGLIVTPARDGAEG